MGTWAGPTHGCVEYVRDTTSPLWSRRVVEDELSLPAPERARALYHERLLELLAPDLVAIPYERGRPRTSLGKLSAELRRRLHRRRSSALDPVFAEIGDAVLSQSAHPAWPLLDRPRVEQLLATPAEALDAMSRYYVWRLATVFSLPLD